MKERDLFSNVKITGITSGEEIQEDTGRTTRKKNMRLTNRRENSCVLHIFGILGFKDITLHSIVCDQMVYDSKEREAVVNKKFPTALVTCCRKRGREREVIERKSGSHTVFLRGIQ